VRGNKGKMVAEAVRRWCLSHYMEAERNHALLNLVEFGVEPRDEGFIGLVRLAAFYFYQCGELPDFNGQFF